MSKKKSTYSMKLKRLSDIPPGAVMFPQNHPADNLATRGAVPLGQSGAQMLSPTEGTQSEGMVGNSKGGGTTGT